MDVSDASYYIFNEKENKGSQMGHTNKILKKTIIRWSRITNWFTYNSDLVLFGTSAPPNKKIAAQQHF